MSDREPPTIDQLVRQRIEATVESLRQGTLWNAGSPERSEGPSSSADVPDGEKRADV